MTTPDPDWPIDPDKGIPPSWEKAIAEVRQASTPNAIQAAVQKAEALRLLDDMKFRRVVWHSEARHWANNSADEAARHTQMKSLMKAQMEAADRQANAVKVATWVLAGATVGLFLATVGLIWATVAA
jgi:hypothetical protein